MTDHHRSIDPLFTGLTRPPLVIGVPMEYFGLLFIAFGLGMIGFTSLKAKALYFVLICCPLYLLGYLFTEKEPHWMRVYLTKLTKCGPTRNKRFWKCNSYGA